MSFGSSYISWFSQILPIGPIIVAPYWTDIDLSNGEGSVNYTVLLQSNGSSYIDMVDRFLNKREIEISTTMIIVAQWFSVCQYLANTGCSASVCRATLFLVESLFLGKLLSSSDSY